MNPAGIIATVAGNGTQGFSGDGGAAASTQLSSPFAVTLDALGNLYIADSGNNRIRRVNPAGIITTVAGNGSADFGGDGGAAALAQLWGPVGVALDSSGNLYIAEELNHCVRKVNTSGIITTIAGNGIGGYSGDGGDATSAQLSDPLGIALDSQGNLYIADVRNQRIRKVR